jgi:hypothetical protein
LKSPWLRGIGKQGAFLSLLFLSKRCSTLKKTQ